VLDNRTTKSIRNLSARISGSRGARPPYKDSQLPISCEGDSGLVEWRGRLTAHFGQIEAASSSLNTALDVICIY
jgi:hypothetical protein